MNLQNVVEIPWVHKRRWKRSGNYVSQKTIERANALILNNKFYIDIIPK